MALVRKVKAVEGVKPIPADIYPAKLVSITEGEGNFGNYFKLEFEVSEGSFAKEKRTIVASDRLTRGPKGNSKLLDILEALLGSGLDINQEVNLEDFMGKECRIVVDEPRQKDGITVQNISKVMPSKK